jgi:aminoglycoside 6'-N-acetyltransferase
MSTTIYGESVLLRSFRADETQRLMAVYARGGQTTAGPVTERSVRAKIEASGTWSDAPWGMILAIDTGGDVVGEVQARGGPNSALPPGVYELGIEIYDESDRGRGIGTDAIASLTRHLFDEDGATRVQLSTDVENRAMRTVADRAGFRFEGIMRSYAPAAQGESRHDYALYARTRDDHESE